MDTWSNHTLTRNWASFLGSESPRIMHTKQDVPITNIGWDNYSNKSSTFYDFLPHMIFMQNMHQQITSAPWSRVTSSGAGHPWGIDIGGGFVQQHDTSLVLVNPSKEMWRSVKVMNMLSVHNCKDVYIYIYLLLSWHKWMNIWSNIVTGFSVQIIFLTGFHTIKYSKMVRLHFSIVCKAIRKHHK